MSNIGTVCIFSEDTHLLYEQAAYLTDKSYLVFTTPNIYKFVRYVRELQPNLLIFDMDASALSDERILNYLRRYYSQSYCPILLLGTVLDKCYRGIAHYVQKPCSLEKLEEIIESYCQGNKKHDVLLIDECASKDTKVVETIRDQQLSCFEISDASAARYYLLKNNPRCICLNLPYDKCSKFEAKLQHDRIFFVDNYKQVKNLARLI